ncbi:hypothetical protein PHLCEN_2v8574 [Hermanssonia centrifuga]|uniref:Uncharacterized protein n=1 Tax=Hermanssonia centrifuga TaxID=98765 RepID=A0A2R6NT97_9APHY|nr:hypothetical protein PHLCEN_2v8574 [Hermanssonia centrifuga]
MDSNYYPSFTQPHHHDASSYGAHSYPSPLSPYPQPGQHQYLFQPDYSLCDPISFNSPELYLPPYEVQEQSQQPRAYEVHSNLSPLIHAPIPISAYSTLLPSIEQSQPLVHSQTKQDCFTSAESVVPAFVACEAQEHYGPLDCYVDAPQATFPTPCELLNELAARDRAAHLFPSDPGASSSMSSADEHLAKSKPKKTWKSRPVTNGKPENQRKAYFRSVAENVGFKPTDPDTITSHDKKRHYLECLEQYVLYLHEQIRLVGSGPSQFNRVVDYRGLNSRSIRNESRRLHLEVREEERTYTELLKSQTFFHSQGAADIRNTGQPAVHDLRRNSIASGMIPRCAALHTAIPPQPHCVNGQMDITTLNLDTGIAIPP